MRTAAARSWRLTPRALASIGLACGAAVAADAERRTPASGQYIAESGWGSLSIRHDAATGTRFRIDSRGANGHVCGLSGTRAGFEGDHLVRAPNRSDGTRRRSEDAFITDDRAGRCVQAAATLQPVLDRCSRTLGPEEDARLRNDLAVTLFHLDRRANCRSMLAPLQKMTADSLPMRLRDVAPTDFGIWSAIASTTRHNLTLCAEASP